MAQWLKIFSPISVEQPGLLRDDISDTEGGTNVKVETPIAPASKPVGRPPKNRRSKRKSTPLPVRDIDVFGDQSIEEVYHSGNDTSTLLDHSETHGGSMKSSSPVELTASPKERRRRKNGVKRRRKTRTPRTYGKTRSHLSKALKYCICKEVLSQLEHFSGCKHLESARETHGCYSF